VPGNIAVGIGDTLLIVNVPPTSDPSVVQWNVYCDPPPSEASALETMPVDAASNDGVCTASEAGADGGDGNVRGVDEAGGSPYIDDAGETVTPQEDAAATEDGRATTSYGRMTLIPSKYLCGSVSASSTEANVLGLRNGNYYNVAVAAVDALGNVGPLSNVECAEPVPVNDFWRDYYRAGGQAGGGFCSARGVGEPSGTDGIGLIVAAGAVALLRRRAREVRRARSV
jgi:hypothetical protein